ncbi:MAG TPA: NAD(P)H-hydrate epimerase, partial [Herpetosiphonaceae bacterium]
MTQPFESYLVTASQMRELEARSVAEGATWAGLMAQAGRGVADHVIRFLGGSAAGRRALALVGPGNNGGDALVAARHLAEAGAAVALYVWKRRPDESDWSWQAVRALGPEVVYAADDPDAAALRGLLAAADLALDGLLGVGVNRPLAPELARIVAAVNDSGAPVVAIDVPTGLDADTGKVWGAAINAELTVATGLLKRGHRLGPGAGRVALAPIDLPASWEESMNTTDLSEATLRSLLPARPAESHKGTFGKALVVAGSYFYPGAAALAAG